MNYQKRSESLKCFLQRLLAVTIYLVVLSLSIAMIHLYCYASFGEDDIVYASYESEFKEETYATTLEKYETHTLSIEDKDTEEYDVEDEDLDPLSECVDNENILDRMPLSLDELISKYSVYFDHPGTPFVFRGKRDISPDDYQIIINIVTGEVGYCSFEQMVAEASLCINLIRQEQVSMYELVMRPGVFLPEYAFREKQPTEKIINAVDAAVFGLDFSLGATAACTYDWMDNYYKEWFDTLHLTTKIEDSSFYCDPESILNDTQYVFSEELKKEITLS